jgi:hypothetical protein
VLPSGWTLAIVENIFVLDQNLHISVDCFVDRDAVDTVVEDAIVSDLKALSIVWRSGRVYSFTVNYMKLILHAVVIVNLVTISDSWIHVEWDKVTVGVHNVSDDFLDTISSSFGKHNCWSRICGAPSGAVDPIFLDVGVILSPHLDDGGRQVVYLAIINFKAIHKRNR